MKMPIEMMMDGVEWKPVEWAESGDGNDGVPYATHSGVLNIMGKSLRCYRLNTGQAVFDSEDFIAFFDGAAD